MSLVDQRVTYDVVAHHTKKQCLHQVCPTHGPLAFRLHLALSGENLNYRKRLPGLSASPEQLFFLGYASIWCANMTDKYAKTFNDRDNHSPNKIRPVFENVDKITEIIEVDQHVSSRTFAQELKIDHKTILNHLRKVGFKKKLYVWVRPQLTPINMMDRIFICEAVAKRNEIDPFLKQMVTGNEKWVTYGNIVRK
ncbi:histone-lysine N-methyltransferase SETMAR [Trichonephila clavipes]|nr:histone-lysine N-methyltransferase SETMAR [Trichonephila clavipes]